MHLIHCLHLCKFRTQTVVEQSSSMAQYIPTTGMDLLNKLCSKKNLDASDAFTLLRYIQEESTPYLSVHTTSRVTSDARECDVGTKKEYPSSQNVSRSKATATRQRSPHMNEDVCVRGRNLQTDGRLQSTPPDFSSVEEFPPMSSAATGSGGVRRKYKSSMSSSSPRRITLTPHHSQHHTHTPFTSPTATLAHSSPGPWSSNPAFTSQCTSSDKPNPITQAEERQLLQQKKQKHNKSECLTQSKSSIKTVNSPHVVGQSSENSVLISLEDRMSGKSSRRSEGRTSGESVSQREGTNIDSKIINHSIFSLTNSSGANSNPKSPNLSTSCSAKRKPNKPVTSESFQGRTSSATPPRLTSTPVQPVTPAHPCLERVTNRDVLDQVADLYSSLIKKGRVSNLTSEIHFVVRLLTLSGAQQPGAHYRQLQGSSKLFVSLDSCVYFAVAVLSRIKGLLTHLDKSTLQLLAENPRISDFQSDSELTVFFTEACENVTQDASVPHSLSLGSTPTSNSVLFQQDTDNSKNFPSMKAFHTFKKQRDLFYSIFREWEEKHDNPGWSFQESVSDRMRLLIKQYGDVCNLSHLACLFQKQLIESCKYPVLACSGDLGNSGLAGHIKNTDPRRLLRLAERFFLPFSTSGAGVCPPPSFTATEDFFKMFILEADSYIFNQHLKNALHAELTKLHQTCPSVQPKYVPDLLYTLRTSAKFLGFLEFLPYNNAPTTMLSIREMVQPFDLLKFVSEARVKGHLSVTIPWVVQYLGMMDPQATRIDHYRKVVTTLMDLYMKLIQESATPNHVQFLIVTSLGWLFEIPSVPRELFYDHLRDSSVDSVPPPSTDLSESLDRKTDAVSISVLYTCCPYLNEIRSLLAEFSAGLNSKPSPIRKIKPLSTSIDIVETNPSNELQRQLQESFFRGHPPYLKQVCEVTSERVSASAIAHCKASILHTSVAMAMEHMARWINEKCVLCATSPPENMDLFTKEEGEWQLLVVLDSVYQSTCQDARMFINKHCTSQTSKALQLLMSKTISEQVITAASCICTEWAIEKCTKWVAEKVRAHLHEELTKGLERARRSIRTACRVRTSSPIASINETTVSSHKESSAAVSKTTPCECVNVECGVDKMPRGSVLELTNVLFDNFKALAHQVMCCEGDHLSADLCNLLTTLNQLVSQLEETSYVTPNIPLPQVLPVDCEEVCALSVDLAIHLVSRGLLSNVPTTSRDEKPSTAPSPKNKVTPRSDKEAGLLAALVHFWTTVKGLKQEVPFSELLSARAFVKYFQEEQQEEGVWTSLSAVVTAVVDCELTASSFIEGMWMCRQQQLPDDQQQAFLRAAVVFLHYWYNRPITTYVEVIWESHDNQMTTFRRIHFTRLLSIVVSELDHSQIPRELLTMQNNALVALVNPFNNLCHS